MYKHSLIQIVKGTDAIFTHVCNGIVYYKIDVEDSTYQIGINSTEEEWKTTFLEPKFKAITLMRWIRKSIKDETLICLK